ncbi:sodium/hydrogen exchanger 9B1 [Halictus rubicundus]|uniref:sodium/hydrogen exchanger 9B1 n=1 Tax=Halictus rubicundus TaxID=77578 RepID=UPI0040352EA3
MPERRIETQQSEERGEEEFEDEDATCCHRMTFISPLIRNILVTQPVSSYLCQRFIWSDVFWLATTTMIGSMTWAVLFFLLGDTMLPFNAGFGLFSIMVFSYTLGWSLSYLPYLHLPPVFGMLLGGMIIRNSGVYDIHHDLDAITTSKIRTFCVTFIMIRVGLQVSMTSLKRYSTFLVTLALIPSSVELFVLSICCKTILDYPWDWSFMVGTILTCLSPVVTMNCVLALAEQGYGEDKSMASILCTAACIDDVNIVSVFVVCFSIVFGEGDPRWWLYIPVGLRDLLLGIVTGVAIGFCLIFFPHRSHKYAAWHRLIGLILGSLMFATAAMQVTVSAGGYLAVVVFSITAVTGWRVLSANFQSRPFQKAVYALWHLVQPLLVGVIGADIDIAVWAMPRFGLHVLCILLGLTARSITAYATTMWTPFSWKERLFVVVCWIPKGTLQAALGPMAFERLKAKPDNENLQMAMDVMKISVVAVFFLAPIGAFVITFSGPRLLNQITIKESELTYLRRLSLLPNHAKKGPFRFTPEHV